MTVTFVHLNSFFASYYIEIMYCFIYTCCYFKFTCGSKMIVDTPRPKTNLAELLLLRGNMKNKRILNNNNFFLKKNGMKQRECNLGKGA